MDIVCIIFVAKHVIYSFGRDGFTSNLLANITKTL